MDADRHQRRSALKRKYFVWLFGALVVLLAAVLALWWFARPAPLLRQASFTELPGWQAADLNPALAAFRRSCAVIGQKQPNAAMGDFGGTAADWRQACADGTPGARAFFEKNFTPYALSGAGLFTGYYEPQIRGSVTRHGAYQTPVYGVPDDLIRVELGQFSSQFKGEHISGRLDGRKLVPYASRAEIDAHGVAAAKILFWSDDPVALFFLQIQGSGRVAMDDGTIIRIGYAGENGRPYTAIGRVLVAGGHLARGQVTLGSIKAWLKSHPALAKGVMEADQSFIFFQEAPLGDPALGSPGVEGVKLTPLGSLAIDLRKNILGAPYYVDADPVHALLVAQDTGGAIRGQVRGDVYFGFGGNAENAAGAMKATGRLFMLLPNAVAARLGRQLSTRVAS